jgi:hypothetical protein
VLVIEDLQWSDHATVDFLSPPRPTPRACASPRPVHVRPADAIVRGHPVATIKRELVRKQLCDEILLAGLSGADVASYLAVRFPGARLPGDLLPLLLDRSDGNPFFLVTLVDHLLDRRLLVATAPAGSSTPSVETLSTTIPRRGSCRHRAATGSCLAARHRGRAPGRERRRPRARGARGGRRRTLQAASSPTSSTSSTCATRSSAARDSAGGGQTACRTDARARATGSFTRSTRT